MDLSKLKPISDQHGSASQFQMPEVLNEARPCEVWGSGEECGVLQAWFPDTALSQRVGLCDLEQISSPLSASVFSGVNILFHGAAVRIQ